MQVKPPSVAANITKYVKGASFHSFILGYRRNMVHHSGCCRRGLPPSVSQTHCKRWVVNLHSLWWPTGGNSSSSKQMTQDTQVLWHVSESDLKSPETGRTQSGRTRRTEGQFDKKQREMQTIYIKKRRKEDTKTIKVKPEVTKHDWQKPGLRSSETN